MANSCNPCTTCHQQACTCSDTPKYSELGCTDYPGFKCVQLKEKDCNGVEENFPCLGISTPDSLYDLVKKLEYWKCQYNILAEQIKLSTDECNPLVYGEDGGITLSIPKLIQCMQDYGCNPCGADSTCACSAPEDFAIVFDGRGLVNPNTFRVKATWQEAVCTPTVTYDFQYKLSSSSNWITQATSQLGTSNSALVIVGGETYDFRLRAKGNDNQCQSNYVYLNNVFVTACYAPTNAMFNPTTPTLTWNSGVGLTTNDFLIEVRKDNESSWAQIATAVVESPSGSYTVDLSAYSFTPNYIYHFRISNICGGGNVISASGTGCAYDCVIANQTEPTVTNITTTSAQINWTFAVGATGYSLTVNGGVPFSVGNINHYVVNGLTPNTSTTVKVSPQCPGVSGTCSGKSVTFGTDSSDSCPNPSDLEII